MRALLKAAEGPVGASRALPGPRPPNYPLVYSKWGFPKIGDPNIVPLIVGSLLKGPQNRVPLILGKSQVSTHC